MARVQTFSYVILSHEINANRISGFSTPRLFIKSPIASNSVLCLIFEGKVESSAFINCGSGLRNQGLRRTSGVPINKGPVLKEMAPTSHNNTAPSSSTMPVRSGTGASDDFGDPADPLFNRFKSPNPPYRNLGADF
jgi:hypothetical protein